MKKRNNIGLTAAVLSAVMSLSVFGAVPASAASMTVPSTGAYVDQNPTIGGDVTDVNKNAAASSVAGIGGKQSSDYSMKIPNSTSGSKYIDWYVGYDNGTGKVTYEMGVYSNIATTIVASMRLNDSNAKNIVQLYNNGDVILGTDTQYRYYSVFQKKKWTKIAMTVDLATEIVYIRINGELLKADGIKASEINSGITDITKITRLRIGIYENKSGTSEDYLAVDDIKVYAGDYDSTGDGISIASNFVDVPEVKNDKIYIADDIYLDEFNDNFTYNSAYNVAFFDSSMNSIAPDGAITAGSVIFVEDTVNGKYKYYTVAKKEASADDDLIYRSSDIRGIYDTALTDTNADNEGKWYKQSGSRTTVTTGVTGIGGRAVDDACVTLTNNPTSKDNEHLSYIIQSSKKYANEYINLEYSVYSAGIEISPMMRINNGTEQKLLYVCRLKTTGSVDIVGSTDSSKTQETIPAKYTPYGWNRIQLKVYNGSNKIDLYVNGEFIKSIETDVTIAYVYTLRMVAATAGLNDAEADADKFFAVDDVYIYNGEHKAACTIPEAEAVENKAAVSGAQITLKNVPEGQQLYTNDVADYVTMPESTGAASYDIKYYTDKTCTETTSSITNGTTACIADYLNNMYRYYTFNIQYKIPEPEFELTVDNEIMKKLAAGAVTVALKNTDESGKLIIALYKSDKTLEKCVISDTKTASMTVDDAEGKTLRCLFWGGVNGMIPLAVAKDF